MLETFKSRKFKSLLPYFLFAVAVIVVFQIINEIEVFASSINRIWSILTPFFYGFLLAYILNLPFSGLQRLIGKIKIKFINKRKKLLSLIITYLLFLLTIFFIVYLLIPYIYRIISFFIENLNLYYERILQHIHNLNRLNIPGIHISPDGVLNMLQNLFQNIDLERLFSSINLLLGVPSAIFIAFLAFISSIYILIEKEKFTKFICRLLQGFTSSKVSAVIMKYTSRLNQNFKRYIFVQTIDGLILGSIVTIQLLIFRSPYFLVLGIILGILNYIPYFGSIIGTIIAIIVIMFTQGIAIGAIAAVVLIITQQIDGNIIQPKLMGGSFSLSPLLIIFSVTVGGAIAGALGMIAAIPIVAILKDILESIIAYRERQKIEPADTSAEE